ncbi:MAG: cytochrome b N-terminal domain-containing protein [Chloroflexota bacterium]
MSTGMVSPPAPDEVSPSSNGAVETAPADVDEKLGDQFALGPLIRDYVIPVETNNIWYALGGVLAISLALEVLTGLLLSLNYTPDAGRAYDITAAMLQSPPWSIVLNFHYWNAFVVFGLVMVHMMRVFISGGYRHGKKGLWTVGVLLAAFTFLISLTGEALHWDEVGFGVPWNISEFLNAIGLAGTFNYTTDALLNIPVATEKLSQIYAVHIAIVPILLVLLIMMHYYLVKVKGISMPFWLKPSGRKAPFTEHIKVWMTYATIILGIVLLVSIFIQRDPGTSPQLVQSSPLFNSGDDPGGLGYKPTFPISWTRGMNVVVANLGIHPDIWGSVLGMVLLLVTLLAIPFIDRHSVEPRGWAAAFNLRTRGWAFLAIAVFWLVLIGGLVASAITEAG